MTLSIYMYTKLIYKYMHDFEIYIMKEMNIIYHYILSNASFGKVPKDCTFVFLVVKKLLKLKVIISVIEDYHNIIIQLHHLRILRQLT